MSDNDRLLSNIADFLADGQRTYELVDFPYFFGERVDLMYAGEKAIGGDVLSQAGLLQRAFDAAGKKLIPRKADSLGSDSLFVGLFDGTEYVQRYLASRQISITLSSETPPPGRIVDGDPLKYCRADGDSRRNSKRVGDCDGCGNSHRCGECDTAAGG